MRWIQIANEFLNLQFEKYFKIFDLVGFFV